MPLADGLIFRYRWHDHLGRTHSYPPSVAAWITATFGVEAHAVRDLGLRDAEDSPIFQAARAFGAVVMTKDRDFIEMLRRLGRCSSLVVDLREHVEGSAP